MNKTLLFLTCVCLSFSQIQGAYSDRAPMCIKKNGKWKLNLSVMAPGGLNNQYDPIKTIERKTDFAERCEELSGDGKNIFRKAGEIPEPAKCPEGKAKKNSLWNIFALHRTDFSLEAIEKYNNQEGNTYKGDACGKPWPFQ